VNKVLEVNFQVGYFEVYNELPNHLELLHVHQTHSSLIIPNKSEMDSNTKADGMILALKDLGNASLAVKTADCLPILYLSHDQVALVHAGWRGLKQKIHLDAKLVEIKPHTIFIGPSIGAGSFEVTAEFKDHFPQSPNFIYKSGKIYFDLAAEALSQLKKVFPDTKITISGICTFENNQYNSYRKTQTKIRNWNIFRINI
jgi:YfiH family protein